MKKSLLIAFSIFFVSTHSFSQWEKIGEVQDNLERLYQINDNKTIAIGSNTQIYDLNNTAPIQATNQLTTFGFITSLLNINNNESYLGGGCYFTFDECPANTLYKTTDNSETWQPLNTDATFTGTGNIFGIIPINEEELFLITEYSKLITVNISTGEATPLLIPGTEEANTFTFGKVSQSGKWLVAASFYDPVNQNTLQYYESLDSGSNWQVLDLDFEEDERIAFIDYLPNNILALVTNNGNVHTVEDGEISLPIAINDVNFQIRAQYIINDSEWYIASYDQENNESKLHLSIDGGQTWSIEHTFEEGFITDLSFIDRNNGFLILNNYEIYKRTGPNSISNVKPIEISISPNPANDFIRISTNEFDNIKALEIIDIMGRKVKKFSTSKPQYNVSDLASGFYQFLVLSNSGDVIAQKSFIKQ